MLKIGSLMLPLLLMAAVVASGERVEGSMSIEGPPTGHVIDSDWEEDSMETWDPVDEVIELVNFIASWIKNPDPEELIHKVSSLIDERSRRLVTTQAYADFIKEIFEEKIKDVLSRNVQNDLRKEKDRMTDSALIVRMTVLALVVLMCSLYFYYFEAAALVRCMQRNDERQEMARQRVEARLAWLEETLENTEMSERRRKLLKREWKERYKIYEESITAIETLGFTRDPQTIIRDLEQSENWTEARGPTVSLMKRLVVSGPRVRRGSV